jgi:integrase
VRRDPGSTRPPPLPRRSGRRPRVHFDGRRRGHQVAFLRNHFKPALTRALPDHADLRFHDLRHVYASMLNYEGVDSFTIAEQLGHSTMTARYTHGMRDATTRSEPL